MADLVAAPEAVMDMAALTEDMAEAQVMEAAHLTIPISSGAILQRNSPGPEAMINFMQTIVSYLVELVIDFVFFVAILPFF